MVRVFPFRGIIYNKKKLRQLSQVMSPPYDVISPAEQEELYEQNNFNFIRLILGKEFAGDNEYNNRYVRAAAFLDGWLRHKIFLQDDKPAFYAYEQKFTCLGKKYSRLGFFGVIRLEDMGRGKVYPHEETYPKAKLDRLQLMRATNANLDSVFAFYSDKKDKLSKLLKQFTKKAPTLEAKDRDGGVNRLWRIDKKPALVRIMQEMKDKAVFIADGHHRYEAAIRYKNELKARNTKFTEDESYNHALMYFTPVEGKGLVVLPIHRTVSNLEYYDPIRFEDDLRQVFNVTPYLATKKTADGVRKKLLKEMTKVADKHAFGLYLGNHRFYLLTLKDEALVEEMVAEEKPAAWKKLDVTILHYAVFDRLLNIAHETEDKVTYFKRDDDAIKAVDDGRATMAILMNPTRIEEIIAVAGELEKMPHKSTYFYPKLLSGLVINRFEHGDKVKP
ncbi:MAG: DUF1015 domain-containing protein [Candidatus Margulisbacteria bacterium]|jgi:uncharacterized protein (DUF1015 family)|nr:DUF1015 domain-containing protein [Candidatus Margulisiibacteriota bacterium]